MKKAKYEITVPRQVVKTLKLKNNEPLNLHLKQGGFTVNKEKEEKDEVPVWWILVPALLAGVLFYGYFAYRRLMVIPLTGRNSIGEMTIGFGVVFGTLLFTWFLIKARRSNQNTMYRNIYWRNFPAIVVSFAVILLMTLLACFWILGNCFSGLSFDLLTAAVILTVFDAFINYVMITLAVSLTPTVLVDLLNLIIICGIMLSMLTNKNKHWWRHNLSYLGSNRAINGWQFNLTLIFAALLLLVLIDYLFVSLKTIRKADLNTLCLRILLSVLALGVFCIGIVPNDRNVPWMHFVHTQFSWSLVVIIIILIAGIKWLMPNATQNFVVMSYIIGIFLLVCSLLFWFTDYLSLTAFEMISFVSAFGWVMMLFQFLLGEINHGTREFKVIFTKTS